MGVLSGLYSFSLLTTNKFRVQGLGFWSSGCKVVGSSTFSYTTFALANASPKALLCLLVVSRA